MPHPQPDDSAKQRPMSTSKPDRKAEQRAEEFLREQTKTETEQRPYLDTEGGE
jgi:hypothetical protein